MHAEVYSRAVQDLVGDKNEQDRLFRGFENMPVVHAKAAWCLKWIDDSQQPFPTRLVAFAIVEGVFFSSSFAAIFWLRQRGLMPGLVQANAMIARDEGMHVSFACLLYRHIQSPVDNSMVHAMLVEAVSLEQAFFEGQDPVLSRFSQNTHYHPAALPQPLLGMNSGMMRQYVEYVADFLLKQLGLPALYHATNPV